MKSIVSVLSDFRTIFFIYILLVIVATIQSLPGRNEQYDHTQYQYTRYNNYIIFRNSSIHLQNGENMYIHYPEKQHDLYKYSPTFAFSFSALAILPDYLGLGIWNLINSLILLFAIYKIPKVNYCKKAAIALLIAPELMTSLQNEQSNGLMAGLIIAAFVLSERKMFFLASGCLVATVFIKLFGLVAFAVFLLYPDKIKTAYYCVFWSLLFLLLPLFMVSVDGYLYQVQSWRQMLSEDYLASSGISVMGILESWFGWDNNKNVTLLSGVILFLITLSKVERYNEYRFRILLLVSCLIWMVIFNHKAESPTFIIAVSGVAIWYFTENKHHTIFQKGLLIFVLILTSLSPTDIFPQALRADYVIPFALKALPCVLVWFVVCWEMLKPDPYPMIPNRDDQVM